MNIFNYNYVLFYDLLIIFILYGQCSIRSMFMNNGSIVNSVIPY